MTLTAALKELNRLEREYTGVIRRISTICKKPGTADPHELLSLRIQQEDLKAQIQWQGKRVERATYEACRRAVAQAPALSANPRLSHLAPASMTHRRASPRSWDKANGK